MTDTMKRTASLGIFCGFLLASAACERPPVDHREIGWRGIGLQEVENPRARTADSTSWAESVPPTIPAAPGDGTPAPPGTWENVQVLGNLSANEFNRTMAAITLWVSPTEGCNYCHVVNEDGTADLASDDIYTKVVSRQMFRMIKEINSQNAAHVGDAGVTCYTCHVGNPVPENIWFYGDQPEEGLRHFLDQEGLRVQSDYALASEGDNNTSIPGTIHTYETMMHISNSLGVGCTYCHQTSRWADWEESPPARVKALRGIRMVRAANMGHLVPLQPEWPAERLGPIGDGPKLECSTCHQGANKPQYGLVNGDGWPALHLPPAAHPTAAAEGSGSTQQAGGGSP